MAEKEKNDGLKRGLSFFKGSLSREYMKGKRGEELIRISGREKLNATGRAKIDMGHSKGRVHYLDGRAA